MSRDVGVGQLVEELEQRGDRLPFEIGAFVALEACEGLLHQSARVEPDDVRVTVDGSVVLARSAASAEPEEAARCLVSVLARLLVAAGPGVPPYLLQLVKESSTGQTPRGLRDLYDAIEASLIPLNRGASRRVLARLVRESDRPPAPAGPQVDADTLDAELEELLSDPSLRTQGREPDQAELSVQRAEEEGPVTERIRMPREIQPDADTHPDTAPDRETAASTDVLAAAPEATTAADAAAAAGTGPAAASAPKSFPPPVPDRLPPSPGPAAATAQRRRPVSEPVTATIRKWQPTEEQEAQAPRSEPDRESSRVPVATTVPLTEPAPETPTESVFSTGSVSSSESIPTPEPLPALESPRPAPERSSIPPRLPRRRGGWGVWLLAATLGVTLYALFATGVLDALLRTAEPPRAGVIDVGVTPPDAQIFVFVGRGPAVAYDLTAGGTHEFVVFDEGLQPSRAIVGSDAQWSSTEDGPLYELAVQASRAEQPAGVVDLGSPQSDRSASVGQKLGRIRVITNPPSAKVYRYVGRGPTAQIPVSSIHEGQEVLVYHSDHETRRAVIGPSDWKRASEDRDDYSAELKVRLPALPAPPLAETTED